MSYATIRFKLTTGLYDTEIKEDILSLEEKSLDETVKAIEAKESRKQARQTQGTQSCSCKDNKHLAIRSQMWKLWKSLAYITERGP